ncbi:MAG: hypothetical protein K9H16_06930 [Bacteroidales bacterium]|nr:hypothetical protein [Bacteroidales bacterium]
MNPIMIRNKIDKTERFRQLKDIAKLQKKSLGEKDFIKAFKKISDDVYIN